MLRIIIKQGRGIPFIRAVAAHRWFAQNQRTGASLPTVPCPGASERTRKHGSTRSGPLGASVTMRWENANDPNDLFEQHARKRAFTN